MDHYSSIFKTFIHLKPFLVQLFDTYLRSTRQSTRGRSRCLDLNLFFTPFYSNVRDATSPSNFKEYFGLPKSTYFYYLKLLRTSKIIDTFQQQITQDYQLSPIIMGDTFTVKSHNGHQGVGRSCTDRGRKGIKVQVISDTNGVVHSLVTSPANVHDSKIFTSSLTDSSELYNNREILLDAAYVGNPVRQVANSRQLVPIVAQRRTTSGTLTHQLTPDNLQRLRQRWRVEQHIGVIRRFKGISNKYTRKLTTYQFYLSFSKLLINCYRLKPNII